MQPDATQMPRQGSPVKLPTRLQVLALDALETEISSTITAVQYRRRTDREKTEREALTRREHRERIEAEQTRERLQTLTDQEREIPKNADIAG